MLSSLVFLCAKKAIVYTRLVLPEIIIISAPQPVPMTIAILARRDFIAAFFFFPFIAPGNGGRPAGRFDFRARFAKKLIWVGDDAVYFPERFSCQFVFLSKNNIADQESGEQGNIFFGSSHLLLTIIYGFFFAVPGYFPANLSAAAKPNIVTVLFGSQSK